MKDNMQDWSRMSIPEMEAALVRATERWEQASQNARRAQKEVDEALVWRRTVYARIQYWKGVREREETAT